MESMGAMAYQLGQRVLRGMPVGSREEVQELLGPGGGLVIGNIEIPESLEPLGFFYVGAPGSGKTQTILQNVEQLLERGNTRLVIIDREGEILEKFYDPERFILFHPEDERSVRWGHYTEKVALEQIAHSLIPRESHKQDPFWADAAAFLLTDIYQVARDNSQVDKLLNLSVGMLRRMLPRHRWFNEESRTATSVLAIARTHLSFYRYLSDEGEPFSFYHWACSDDPRSLIIPIFAATEDRYRGLFTMALRQVCKGLISYREGERPKTALVIDELGALHPIPEIMQILAQGRKYKVTFIGATQTLYQLEEVYGPDKTKILLQTTKTKLYLNCPDYHSASKIADQIGKQECIELRASKDASGAISWHEVGTEKYVIHPSEIQNLPPLTGYLHISNGTPIALVSITIKDYPIRAQRHRPRQVPIKAEEELGEFMLAHRYYLRFWIAERLCHLWDCLLILKGWLKDDPEPHRYPPPPEIIPQWGSQAIRLLREMGQVDELPGQLDFLIKEMTELIQRDIGIGEEEDGAEVY